MVTGATTEVYARTGYLGFLRRTECLQSVSVLDDTTPSIGSNDNESLNSMNTSNLNYISNSSNLPSSIEQHTFQEQLQQHDAVYVVGALDEVISLRGMNYHPIDVENSVLRCHKKIAEWYESILK